MTSTAISLLSVARRAGCTVTYAGLLALLGCASIGGVGGTAEFGCKAPVGVTCDSLSGTYYNALRKNLPSQQKSAIAAPETSTGLPMGALTGKYVAPAGHSAKHAAFVNTSVTTLGATREANAPLRSAARVLRIWIKPWEDYEGDLHSQCYVYVPIDTGHWLIDDYRFPSREVNAPIREPEVKGAAPNADVTVTGDSPRKQEDRPPFGGSRATPSVRQSSSGDGDDHGR